MSPDPAYLRPVSRAVVEAMSRLESETPRYVIHLPLFTTDLSRAANLAFWLARTMAFLPELDVGETTICGEGAQDVHHRVFCDRLLPDRLRCVLRANHRGPCAADPQRTSERDLLRDGAVRNVRWDADQISDPSADIKID